MTKARTTIPRDRAAWARVILRRLRSAYPVTGPFVEWSTPLELLVGTILSAQCTDARVNMVTPHVFAKYRTARDYAEADVAVLEREIYSTGFYKSKARALKETGRVLDSTFGGQVPRTLDALLTLRGVSDKTAYIVLAKAFGVRAGVAVDTHVFRLCRRIGISSASTPQKMSKELTRIIAPKDQLAWNEYLITHGRAVCGRTQRCDACVLREVCRKKVTRKSQQDVHDKRKS